LAAELLYVQQFFTSVTGPERKLDNVREVLSWSKQPASIPAWAAEGLSYGLARDRTFNQHRPFHLGWLDEYLIHWRELAEGERGILLGNPWRFALDVRAVDFSRGAYQPMREAWLYMVFPDDFENISSRSNKQQIRDAFEDLLPSGPSQNIDLDIFEIRKVLTGEYGEGFHFYRKPIVQRWQQNATADEDSGGQILGTSSPHALPEIPPPRVWIEDTKSTYAHGGPGWEFGSCLWSPSANEIGNDQYAVMISATGGSV
jgi:5-methylcytosine-specific restriction protein B